MEIKRFTKVRIVAAGLLLSSGMSLTNAAVDRIETNFADGTWGTVIPTPSGNIIDEAYTTYDVNGFSLVKALIYAGSYNCELGGTHSHCLVLSRKTLGGMVELPELNTINGLDIHIRSGSADKEFLVEEYVGSSWVQVGTPFTTITDEKVFTLDITRSSNVKLRIVNNSSSSMFIYKLVSRKLVTGIDTLDYVTTDFTDGTWGAPIPKPSTNIAGNYKDTIINDFTLTSVCFYAGTVNCSLDGNVHTNCLVLNGVSYGGSIELPLLKSVAELKIHATGGSAGNQFVVQEYINNVWVATGDTGTIAVSNVEDVFTFSIVRPSVTKLRIVNNKGGAVYIYRITTTPASDSPTGIVNQTSEQSGLLHLSNGVLFVDAKDIVQVSVYDITGKLLTHTLQREIPLKDKGLYLVKVKTKDRLYNAKIINKQ